MNKLNELYDLAFNLGWLSCERGYTYPKVFYDWDTAEKKLHELQLYLEDYYVNTRTVDSRVAERKEDL